MTVKKDDWVQAILTDIKDYHEARQQRKEAKRQAWSEYASVSNHDEIEYEKEIPLEMGKRRIDKWKD